MFLLLLLPKLEVFDILFLLLEKAIFYNYIFRDSSMVEQLAVD